VLGYLIRLFPLGGYGGLEHMVLPTLAMGITGSAWYARMFRSTTLDEVTADYVRTARGKGLRERTIMLRHILPNAIRPVVTMWGMDLGYFLGGMVVVETVFAWPGIGYQAWKAVRDLDIPMIMGTVLFASLFIIVSNILVDISYAWLDPRVRLQ
jgi:peptide/nickel transport system permease protein